VAAAELNDDFVDMLAALHTRRRYRQELWIGR